jgi:hypothetical protein
MTTTILNFGHPLADRVLTLLAPSRQVRVSLQLDMDNESTPPQVVRAVSKALQEAKASGAVLDGTEPVAVVLPGVTEAAAIVLAELHGRLGTFPQVLALRRREDRTYGLFQNSVRFGVVDLERLRQEARERR